jgi:hypothetical protein
MSKKAPTAHPSILEPTMATARGPLSQRCDTLAQTDVAPESNAGEANLEAPLSQIGHMLPESDPDILFFLYLIYMERGPIKY